MGAYDSVPFDSSLEGAPEPALNPNSKHADFDVLPLEDMDNEQAASPDGDASQAAVEPSLSGEANSKAALGGEGPMDTMSIFNQSTPEQQEEAYIVCQDRLAEHGVSPEGMCAKILKEGGPQASARAAQFGVDLMPFADKINPAGAYAKTPKGGAPVSEEITGGLQPVETGPIVDSSENEEDIGQAFGNVPTEGQVGPVKDKGLATSKMTHAVEAQRKQNEADRLAQRAAIGAFLIEAGLKTLSSAKQGVGAVAEGVGGAFESTRKRNTEKKDRTIAEEQRARREKREDEADIAGRLKAKQETEAFNREKGNWEAEDAEARAAEKRKGLTKITDKDGKVHQVKIVEGIARDINGKIIISDSDQLLSVAQQRIEKRDQTRRYDTSRAAIQKEVSSGSYSTDSRIQAIMDMTDAIEQRDAINDLAMERLEYPDDVEEQGEIADFSTME